MAIELVETIVPMCAMLRRSLSSEAAASLMTALTRAASAMGSLRPPSNQRVACSAPPRSLASSRMIREETMSAPIAARAIVLAITIRARSAHHEHEVLAGLGRQHVVPVRFGLAVEQLLADRRDDLHVDAGPRQPRQHAHEIERRARSLGHDVAVSGLAGREVADDVEALGGGP